MFILKLIFFHLDLETNSVPAHCNEPEAIWWELWAASSWPGGLSADAVPVTTHDSSQQLPHLTFLLYSAIYRTSSRVTSRSVILCQEVSLMNVCRQ